ncbi:ALBINO3-like protein 1 [Hibiscus syriacus]|uniref:ALBINO3-like protein 1 n=1 Tax=Hibiscus syriacus TaxID=106335 RepID=A0A6A3ALK9_HIBSY|nr:ALBINO3-like protein 1, chloroplastic [Hibiscus syriacus]KAE8705500.1 ALBINO3-like protein 1 [Hibiscus syriacus]
MASPLSIRPNVLVLSPFVNRTGPPNPLFKRAQFSNHRPFLRGSLSVAKFGFKPGFLPDPDASEGAIRELFTRAESFLYTIADAAVSSSDTITTTTATTAKQNNDWLSGIADSMETVLKVLKDGLSGLHVPYAYGFAIILLTVLVKAATFPLTRKQVESTMAMRSLQPQIKAIQQKYAGDQERIQLETARLYKLAGINPLAGCLPTLATIPVWIGLYRALSNVANEGLLTEGFFWIPSLAGPTTVAARQNGSGISWLFPFVDGHPPLGWSDTFAYLVLPVLLVVSQYVSVQIMQSAQSNDPDMKSSQALTKFLPLMIGYFALSVPSGLSLYWLTNNVLSTAQQVWLQKLGGAKNPAKQLNDDTIKEEQIQLEKSLSELNATRKEAKQEVKLMPDGLRPGDRFKQLKEQEARSRQQREEEARWKAQEVAAKADKSTNEGHEVEGSIIDKENGGGTRLGIENKEKYQSVAGQGASGIGVVNGDLSCGDLKEDQKKASSFNKSNGVSEHVEKETVEVYTGTANTDNEDSEQDTGRQEGAKQGNDEAGISS